MSGRQIAFLIAAFIFCVVVWPIVVLVVAS